MKLNKITSYKHKLIKLKLIRTKVYKKNQNNFVKIDNTINRLKKALHVIYKYHLNNKRILFIGTPIYFNKKLSNLIKKNTKHVLIPESIWMNGILTNQSTCFKYLYKNQKTINRKISEFLFKTKKHNDLIVILDQNSNAPAVSEGYLSRIPVISFNSELNVFDFKSSYKVPGNFKFTGKKNRDNFFYYILSATIKKANANLKSPIKKHFNNIYLSNRLNKRKKTKNAF